MNESGLLVRDSRAALSLERYKPASGKGWKWRASGSDVESYMDAVSQRYAVESTLARIMAGRDITLEEVEHYLSPTLRHLLPNPMHLRDMDKAIARLVDAVRNKETIAVFGDYDVDGATSTSLLLRYFAMLGVPTLFHIPDRIEEGYGPNTDAFITLKDQGAHLIITVDCGTVSYEPIKEACRLGMDVIVVDHHIGGERLPDALAVINPNRLDESSDYGHLAAVGVTFLVLVALNRALRDAGLFESLGVAEPDLRQWLDLVALGTVCDVVPLTTLNRAYVSQGLRVLAQRQNTGLAALSDVSRLDHTPSAYSLGFMLGPRINAGGRVGKASLGTSLLSTEDAEEARHIAAQLDQYNQERKAIEASVLDEATRMAESQSNQPIIMVAKEGWHPGVIGIVAGRLKERFERPAAVIAIDEAGIGKASARSVTGVDVGSAITAATQEGLLLAGGGHAMAGGFSLEMNGFDALYDFFCARLSDAVALYQQEKSRKIDAALSVSGCSVELIEQIEALGPYGMGHPSPTFMIPKARIVRRDVLKEKHIRLKIIDDASGAREGSALTALAFNSVDGLLGDMLLSEHYQSLALVGSLQLNHWQDRISPQLLIDDAAISD